MYSSVLRVAAHELTDGLEFFEEIYYPMLLAFTNFFKQAWCRERFGQMAPTLKAR